MKIISSNNNHPSNVLWRFILISLCIVILLATGLFSSCGFLGGTGVGNFTEDSTLKGDPGDGDTPRLSSRFEDDPDLKDKDCEDNDRCEETCRDIYNKLNSHEACYNLNIGQVANMQEVFIALVDARTEELESIEEDDLEGYLQIGLDGWRVKVIEKQKTKSSRDERFLNTLQWIVDQESTLVSILEEEDRDNEVLEEIFLGYCNIDKEGGDGGCDGEPISSFGFYLDHSEGELFYQVNQHRTKVAVIENEGDNYSLFEALKYGGVEFFQRAANDRRFDAFGRGNLLLDKICTHRNDKYIDQCVRAFYCWLGDEAETFEVQVPINDAFFSGTGNTATEIIETIGREINLNCSGLCNIDDENCE